MSMSSTPEVIPYSYAGSSPGGSIGRCSCHQNRIKFQTRRADLEATYYRLISPNKATCFSNGQGLLSRKQHEARTILNEILRIDSVLEVLGQCKNVFHCASTICQANLFTEGTALLPQSKSHSLMFRRRQHCDSFPGIQNSESCKGLETLPEFLLSPMRTSKVFMNSFKSSSNQTFESQQRLNALPCDNLPVFCSPSDQKCTMIYDSCTCQRFKYREQDEYDAAKPHLISQCDQSTYLSCRCVLCTATPCSQFYGNGKQSENSVLVYGFSFQSIGIVDKMFSLLGRVSRKRISRKSNWAVFCYQDENDASKACSYDLNRICGRIIGVTRCKPSVLDVLERCWQSTVPDDCGIGLVRARKILQMANERMEEIGFVQGSDKKKQHIRQVLPGMCMPFDGTVSARATDAVAQRASLEYGPSIIPVTGTVGFCIKSINFVARFLYLIFAWFLSPGWPAD